MIQKCKQKQKEKHSICLWHDPVLLSVDVLSPHEYCACDYANITSKILRDRFSVISHGGVVVFQK